MAPPGIDDLKRVGDLTMSELLNVANVAIGPGFGDRVKGALEDRRRARILVADGDEDIAQLLKLMLEEEGHVVIGADDGEKALMTGLEQRPDLCVLDTDLAGIGGAQVTKLLRAADQTRFVPILLLSTAVRQRNVAAAEASGASAHLIKPFVPDDLLRSVRRLLGIEAARTNGVLPPARMSSGRLVTRR